jgi:hypothetical protein
MFKTFRTSEILAVIHSFASILAASEKTGVIPAWEKLQEITPKIAGVENDGGDQLGWIDLSQSLRPRLKMYFSALAAEQFPDKAYWSNPAKIEQDKMARLGEWVKEMEKKYGPTQQVPDFSADIRQDMESKDSIRARLAAKTMTFRP